MSNQELCVMEENKVQASEGTERLSRRRVFAPRADILEDADNLYVAADMPGVTDKTVDLTVEKNTLSIRGRIADGAPAGKKLVYGEYEPGDYERTFLLSENIDRNGIQATMKDGMLQVTLPKLQAARAMKISVR